MTAALPELADGDFYYQDLGGGRFRSTIHAQGPGTSTNSTWLRPPDCWRTGWNATSRAATCMARLSYEILGLIPGGEVDVVTRTLRPGRTIELVQAELVAGDGQSSGQRPGG